MLAGFRVRQARLGMRAGRAERGALCAFPGHVWRFCLHLPWSGYGGFPRVILNWPTLLHLCAEWRWRDPDLVLGSPRGGGEVRITETERSERVSAGRRGDRAGIAAPSARTGGRRVCGRCVARMRSCAPVTHEPTPALCLTYCICPLTTITTGDKPSATSVQLGYTPVWSSLSGL